MGPVKDGVVDSDATTGVLGLHLPPHEDTCVLSLNADDSDIPRVWRNEKNQQQNPPGSPSVS